MKITQSTQFPGQLPLQPATGHCTAAVPQLITAVRHYRQWNHCLLHSIPTNPPTLSDMTAAIMPTIIILLACDSSKFLFGYVLTAHFIFKFCFVELVNKV